VEWPLRYRPRWRFRPHPDVGADCQRAVYAVELSPSMLNTQGGPRRNEKAQIVRPDGSPIARLYSAGELGSIYSYLYQGTGNIGECLAFGRIAGRNAAAEQPWV
jgi:predicted oxidoreductase